jgi:hypothetical protein
MTQKEGGERFDTFHDMSGSSPDTGRKRIGAGWSPELEDASPQLAPQ